MTDETDRVSKLEHKLGKLSQEFTQLKEEFTELKRNLQNLDLEVLREVVEKATQSGESVERILESERTSWEEETEDTDAVPPQQELRRCRKHNTIKSYDNTTKQYICGMCKQGGIFKRLHGQP